MMVESPPFLTLRTRETYPGATGGLEQIVEVLDGETVFGQLPVSRVVYELLAQNVGKLSIEMFVEHADVETLSLDRPTRRSGEGLSPEATP